jgi:hypothetical protein
MKRAAIARPPLLLALIALGFGALALAGAVAALAYRQALGEPQTVLREAEALGAALEGARWAPSRAEGPELYLVGFRTCPACIAFKQSEGPWLAASGVQVRSIIFAPRGRASPAEEAAAAELALNRSGRFLDDWFAAPDPAAFAAARALPPPDATPERAAALEANRATVETLERVLKADGGAIAYPALFWRKDGEWRLMLGYSPEKAARVRAELGVP